MDVVHRHGAVRLDRLLHRQILAPLNPTAADREQPAGGAFAAQDDVGADFGLRLIEFILGDAVGFDGADDLGDSFQVLGRVFRAQDIYVITSPSP